MKEVSARILFIGPHRPKRNGSQRFRMEQYFPYLAARGYQCDYSWFINEYDDQIFYSPGNTPGKLRVFMKAVFVRLRDVLNANKYDIIFVQREAFMTGTVFFEKQFARSKAKLIFDFDDAIWLEDTSEGNKSLSWLKRPAKTADIISIADEVIAGNQFLATYAQQFNENVTIIPTVVDTNVYAAEKKLHGANDPVCIGWIGSMSTIKHLSPLIPLLKNLKEKLGDKISISIVGDKNIRLNEGWVEYIEWKAEKEVEQLNTFDIGLMPLPDDDWSKGKCGFKAIQYMALEIPPVASPLGVNSEIIRNGVNGFLAGNDEDWLMILSKLIESPSLRIQMGKSARQTIIDRYSVSSALPLLIFLFEKIMTSND